MNVSPIKIPLYFGGHEVTTSNNIQSDTKISDPILAKDTFVKTRVTPSRYLDKIKEGSAFMSYDKAKYSVFSYYDNENNIVNAEQLNAKSEILSLLSKNKDLFEKLFKTPDILGNYPISNLHPKTLQRIITTFQNDPEYLKDILLIKNDEGKPALLFNKSKKNPIPRYNTVVQTFKDDKPFLRDFLLKYNPLQFFQNEGVITNPHFDSTVVELLDFVNSTFKQDSDFIKKFYSEKNKKNVPYVDSLNNGIEGERKSYMTKFIPFFADYPANMENILKIEYPDGSLLASNISITNLFTALNAFKDDPRKMAEILLMKDRNGASPFLTEHGKVTKYPITVRLISNILNSRKLDKETSIELKELQEKIESKMGTKRPPSKRVLISAEDIPEPVIDDKIQAELEEKWLAKNSFGLNKVQMMLLIKSTNASKKIVNDLKTHPDILMRGANEPFDNGNTALHIVSRANYDFIKKIYLKYDPKTFCDMLLTKNNDGKYPCEVINNFGATSDFKVAARYLCNIFPDRAQDLKKIYSL